MRPCRLPRRALTQPRVCSKRNLGLKSKQAQKMTLGVSEKVPFDSVPRRLQGTPLGISCTRAVEAIYDLNLVSTVSQVMATKNKGPASYLWSKRQKIHSNNSAFGYKVINLKQCKRSDISKNWTLSFVAQAFWFFIRDLRLDGGFLRFEVIRKAKFEILVENMTWDQWLA